MDRQAWLAERRAAVAAAYDAEAGEYDASPYPATSHEAFITRLLDTCPADGTVLDAPCGTGRYFELVRASGCVLHTVHNWHHAPIVRLAADLLRAGEIGRPTRVVWHTLRTQPAAAGAGHGDNWRLDPAVAGGGVLSDHGWHVCYVIQRWLGTRPLAVQARLETRRHTGSPVEDTAALSITFADAVAEVLLTWAADERRNWALIQGESGRIELHDDTLILTGTGAERRRWACPPLSNGSHHPEWFGAVADGFLSEIAGEAPTGTNLAEASLCVMVESLARESSRRGGATLGLSPWPSPSIGPSAHSRAT